MTQFVFSRRDLQTSINRLHSVLSHEQLSGLIKKLNTPNEQRLPTMWELVVLDAFAQVASVRHEVPLPQGSAPIC